LVASGASEIVTYSLVNSKDIATNQTAEFYRLLAPKSEQHVYYRHNAIASHLQVIKRNYAHHQSPLFFYEISQTYQPTAVASEILTLSATGHFLQQKYHHLQLE
jgi:phenylalanyl-tRNA synthetase beta subunit